MSPEKLSASLNGDQSKRSESLGVSALGVSAIGNPGRRYSCQLDTLLQMPHYSRFRGVKMTDQTQEPLTADPDHVPETLCIGKFNISTVANLGVITFTHVRPKAGPQLDESRLEYESVVRARIVTSIENMFAIRDMLNRVLSNLGPHPTEPDSAGGGARLN
jgi:hypothetical protein